MTRPPGGHRVSALCSPLCTQPPMEGLVSPRASSRAGSQPDGASEIPEARGARETAQSQLAAFISTPPQSDAPCAQKQVSSAGA